MKPGNQFYIVLLILAVMSLSLAACSPMDSAAAEEAELAAIAEQEAAQSAAQVVVENAAQEVLSSEAEPAAEEASAPLADEALTAQLTVVQGTAWVQRGGTDAFEEVSGSTELNAGDVVRTSPDGVATLTFADNTDATLFGNTQLAVRYFNRLDSGALQITLQQFSGSTYHRANFTTEGSTYDVESTNTVASTIGGAFYADVNYEELAEGADVLASFIADTPFFQQTLALDPSQLNALGDIESFIDVESGPVKVTYLVGGEGESIDVGAGQTISVPRLGDEAAWMALDEDTLLLNTEFAGLVVLGRSNRSCGDAVCDQYRGENTNSCPADCN